MEFPSRMLYHYWDELETYRDSLDDDEARMHLNLLIQDVIELEIGTFKEQYETRLKKGQVDFLGLWTIYRPR
jgi:hypothetical protein